MMQRTVIPQRLVGTNMSTNQNNNNLEGVDCLSQSEPMVVEDVQSNTELTEEQLLASSQEDMLTDATEVSNKNSTNHPYPDTQLDMDDDNNDGINVIINIPESQPSGSESKTDPSCHPNNANDQQTTKINLTRGQRKKFKALMQSGVSRSEALIQLGKGKDELASSKRGRTDLDNSATSEDVPKQKRTKKRLDPRDRAEQSNHDGPMAQQSSDGHQNSGENQTAGHSYSDMTNRRKVGVVPKHFPTSHLSTTQLDALQEALLLKVEKQRNEPMKPKFCNLLYKSGYMVLVCKDLETADWVKEITPSLIPWEGAELEAMDEEKIQRPEPIRAFFPQSAKYCDERIKTLIESQNKITTSSWRILQRSTPNDIHVEWIFTVDGPSMANLTKSNFILNYRFGEIQLRKIKGKTTQSNENSTNRVPQEKSKAASSKNPQSNPIKKASLPVSKDSSSNQTPSSSGGRLVPSKSSGSGKRLNSTTETKKAGLGKKIDKHEHPKHHPKQIQDDPQHPKKNDLRPGNCGTPKND